MISSPNKGEPKKDQQKQPNSNDSRVKESSKNGKNHKLAMMLLNAPYLQTENYQETE